MRPLTTKTAAQIRVNVKRALRRQLDINNKFFHAWNETQSTYRQNYTFNRTKDALVKQTLLGVDMLTNQKRLSDWNTKKDLSAPYRGLHAFGEFGRNTVGAWSPFTVFK